MFSFEGDFKTRPKVSLSGASRKEERRRLKNAIIIQSFIRGYRDRKQQYSLQRSAFDRCSHSAQSGGTFSITSAPNLTLLVRQLLFFTNKAKMQND
ncbi:Hypothetical predicted protein, partial [Marmota monax]